MTRHSFILKVFSIFILTLSIVFPVSASLEDVPDWSYSGKTGPEFWGELDPAYKKCAIGSNQSPINIDTTKIIEKDDLKDIQYLYEQTNFTLINTGRTIKAFPNKENHSLLIGNEQYLLKQFHVHHPSEHELNDKKFPLEIHLVHQNSKGKLAVVGIFVEEDVSNKAGEKILKVLPKIKGTKEVVKIDLSDLLPEDNRLFTYDGSLTTPPCTENIQWFLFEEPIKLSTQLINKFAELYPANNRPIQDINDRVIYHILMN